MNEAVNSVNYTELVKYYSTKEGSSPKTLKKILDSKVEKSFNNLHQTGGIKMPVLRKADLWLFMQSFILFSWLGGGGTTGQMT